MVSTNESGASPTQNSVTLVGRVSSLAGERELPSGVRIATFRVVVTREKTAMTKASKQVSDWVECTAWTPGQRRTVGRLQVGDVVEVQGALRRRFLRGSGAAASRVEIEVLACRRLERV